MPFQFTCERCNSTFTRRDSYPKRFCSMACYRAPRVGQPGPDGTILVPLTKGAFAVIDPVDAERVLAFSWNLSSTGYAHRSGGRGSMHRFILDAPPGWEVDHVNGDTLDNRRSNLRLATHSENMRNSRLSSRNTSGFRGIYRQSDTYRWVARVRVRGATHHIGSFATREEAAAARDRLAQELHGKFVRLNAISQEH
jgi:hypothetical protein